MHFLIIFFSLFTIPLHALLLENIIAQNKLEETCAHKTIGYFVGSFDPLHKMHEQVIETVLQNGLCDYILIYPAWGGDIYKQRTDIKIRLEMLHATFADHPAIICTQLPPQKLQEAFTSLNHQMPHHSLSMRSAKWDGTRFIGIIGSDTALYLDPNPDTSIYYMTGLDIPEEYAHHTWGSCMALPVESFIVALRNHDDISHLHGHIRERKISTVLFLQEENTLSSTAIKKSMKIDKSISDYVGHPILKIIEAQKLYCE